MEPNSNHILDEPKLQRKMSENSMSRNDIIPYKSSRQGSYPSQLYSNDDDYQKNKQAMFASHHEFDKPLFSENSNPHS